jgi:hypothetical protein
MSFDLKKVPVVKRVMENQTTTTRTAHMYQITDIGRKRLDGMAEAGPSLMALQILATKTYPISAYEILNDLQGQMDKETLRVALIQLISHNCIQKIN